MTNETMYAYIENAVLRKPCLQKDGTTYFVHFDATDTDMFILTDGKGEKVGAVYPMGSSDVHVYVLGGYRGNGYMSRFLESGILQENFPECVNASVTIADSVDMVRTRLALAKKGGFHITNEDEVSDCLDHPEKYQHLFDDDYYPLMDETYEVKPSDYSDFDKNLDIAAALYLVRRSIDALAAANDGVFSPEARIYIDYMRMACKKIASDMDEWLPTERWQDCDLLQYYPDCHVPDDVVKKLESRIMSMREDLFNKKV